MFCLELRHKVLWYFIDVKCFWIMYVVNVNYTFVNFIMTDYRHPLKFMLGPVISQSV